MHPCQGNWVEIGRAVVHFARDALAFSAGIKYQHCTLIVCLLTPGASPVVSLLSDKTHKSFSTLYLNVCYRFKISHCPSSVNVLRCCIEIAFLTCHLPINLLRVTF